MLQNFTHNLISRLQVGPDNTRVGLATFSDNATIRFQLNTYQRQGDMLSAVDALPYTAGRTNTADALRKMTSQMFTSGSGDRPGVPNYAIIISDGVSTVNQQDTLPAAVQAKNSGIHILAVTIIPEGPTLELKGVVNDPYEYNLFSLTSFNDLATIQNRFQAAICNSELLIIRLFERLLFYYS